MLTTAIILLWVILALAFLRWNHVVSQINREIDEEATHIYDSKG